MTTRERVRQFWALYEALDAITEPEEIELYPFLEHLGDLIQDLQIDCEEQQSETVTAEEIIERSHTGWHCDDDLPNVPEASPIDSAQRKRALRDQSRLAVKTCRQSPAGS